jgi:RNA polymerase sigma factor (sigma-70 family)
MEAVYPVSVPTRSRACQTAVRSTEGVALSPAVDLTTQMVQQYGSLVLTVVWRILPSREEAMDVYQETFLRYHTVLQRGETVTHPKAWLCRVATHAALKCLRRSQRQVSLSDRLADGPPADASRQHQAEQQLLMARVRALVADLPQRQRAVFELRNYDGIPFGEIATRLGCSEESARASEYKALKKIRAGMQDHQHHAESRAI